ncbi:MAG: hypothetical protein V4481_04900 [Patescibacteria group bacterium]
MKTFIDWWWVLCIATAIYAHYFHAVMVPWEEEKCAALGIEPGKTWQGSWRTLLAILPLEALSVAMAVAVWGALFRFVEVVK